jgi:hypothetical protein
MKWLPGLAHLANYFLHIYILCNNISETVLSNVTSITVFVAMSQKFMLLIVAAF